MQTLDVRAKKREPTGLPLLLALLLTGRQSAQRGLRRSFASRRDVRDRASAIIAAMPRSWGRGREPHTSMEASRVVALLDHLARRGVTVWLEGGWSVDALVGRERREHDDLDVLVAADDVACLEAALGELGYRRAHGNPPLSFEMVDSAGHQVDVHPVRFTSTGEGRYRMADGRDWIYPPSSLTGIGQIDGVPVRCLTPEFQMICHATGYALDATHRADVAALGERFRIAVPEYESAH